MVVIDRKAGMAQRRQSFFGTGNEDLKVDPLNKILQPERFIKVEDII